MKKTWLPIILISFVLMIAFIALRASGPGSASKNTCKESMEECPKQKNRITDPGGLPWDNLSRQFFSSITSY